ncbi:unnamed protein product [Schistosoma margrebowiei]|uniref:Uncharacterized protein n=1 Tax=Schistosoma margrebowiei TaxID=48269 RepID=A0A3P7YB19_9TREM|nr:unnamed protein product [Schistosoma margrebowiei]
MWNSGHAFRSIWDSSAGCTCISELFVLGLEPSTVRFKRYRVIHLATCLICKCIQLTSPKQDETHVLDSTASHYASLIIKLVT